MPGKLIAKNRLRLVLGSGVLISLLLFLFAIAASTYLRMENANQWSNHTYRVLLETHGLSGALTELDSGARGYAVTGDARFLQDYIEAKTQFSRHLSEVMRLTSDNPLQQNRLQVLQREYRQWEQSYLTPMLNTRQTTLKGDSVSPAFVHLLLRGKPAAETLARTLRDINSAEATLLQIRTQRHIEFQGWTKITLMIGSLVAVSLVMVLLVLLKTYLQELSKMNRELKLEVGERQLAEDALHRAKEEAEQANHAKSEFLSRMSHELRTPLNAILGFGQLLEMDGLDPSQKESVKHILKGGRHLLDLINEVLDIARIEAGRLTLSMEPVAVEGLLKEILELMRPLAAHRGIQMQVLEAEAGTLRETYIQADRQRLKQVLLNLISNAIKYNHDGGRVVVTYKLVEEDRLCIQVRDTGPGISLEKVDRLFVPFDRLDAEQSQTEGTGLGLALSQRLVGVMGGTMGVDSTVGVGSTFWLELPVAENPTLFYESPTAPRIPVETEARESPTRTILYMEDNISNLHLIERILEQRETIKLLSSMQGRLGLEMAREHQPDLILLDLHLPDMTGHEVLMRLKADPQTRDIPIVVVSADATNGQIQRLLSSGACDYLTKPFDLRQFLQLLDRIFQEPSRVH